MPRLRREAIAVKLADAPLQLVRHLCDHEIVVAPQVVE